MNEFTSPIAQIFTVILGIFFFLAYLGLMGFGIYSLFVEEFDRATALFTLLILFKVMQLKGRYG